MGTHGIAITQSFKLSLIGLSITGTQTGPSFRFRAKHELLGPTISVRLCMSAQTLLRAQSTKRYQSAIEAKPLTANAQPIVALGHPVNLKACIKSNQQFIFQQAMPTTQT